MEKKKRTNCMMCGKKLGYRRTVYCSDACHITRTREIAHAKIEKRRKLFAQKACQICFKVFIPGKSSQINCSKECAKIAHENWVATRPKQIKKVECRVCKTTFMQKQPTQYNCSEKCRKISSRQYEKERHLETKKPKKKNQDNHVWNISTNKKVIDKEKLRNDLASATQQFLKAGGKIRKLPDGPNAKIPSVNVKGIADETEFWTEASYGNLEPELLEVEDHEIADL